MLSPMLGVCFCSWSFLEVASTPGVTDDMELATAAGIAEGAVTGSFSIHIPSL